MCVAMVRMWGKQEQARQARPGSRLDMTCISWHGRNAAESGPEISAMARSSSLAATSGKEFMDVILLKSVELLKPVGLAKPVKPMTSVELSKPVKQGGHSVYDSVLWPGCVELP